MNPMDEERNSPLDIIVDPRFRDKIPRPSEEELEQLEKNILTDGYIREPLVVWRKRNVLIDGHNRWAIYQKHTEELPFPDIRQMEFEDENAAEDWMLMNQLGRRNLSPDQCSVLRAQVYRTMRKAHGGDRRSEDFSSIQNGSLKSYAGNTAEKAAKRLGVGKGTIIRDDQFLRGLEAAEEVAPGFKDEVLTGETHAKKADVAELRNKEPEDRLQAIEEIRKPKVTFPSGNVSKPKKLSPAAQEIAENDKRTTDKNAVVEYGIDDLLEDLRMLQNDFIDKYHHAIDLHMDVATDNGRKVLSLMKEFETEWKEVKERII